MHLGISFVNFIITFLFFANINSEKVIKELVKSISEETLSEQENEPILMDKKEDIVKMDVDANITNTVLMDKKEDIIKMDVDANITNTVSMNITKVNCSLEKTYGPVEIVNATRLMELLILEPGPSNRSKSDKENKQLSGMCILVLFYAKWCVFSSQAAPHFNAIPRSFPHIKTVAIDAIKYQSFNAQYGIVGVPTLMLVHNGKPVAKFNDTIYTLESFAKFTSHLTNLQPNSSLYVISADFAGPVSSTPSNETDYCLVLSWIFIIACMLYFTSCSTLWQQFVEVIQNTWRESNAQHEHVD